VSSLFGDSVHYEIRLFELKALQSSERSPLFGMDQVRNSAVTFRSEAIGRELWPSATHPPL
jgi:hypothetical protein